MVLREDPNPRHAHVTMQHIQTLSEEVYQSETLLLSQSTEARSQIGLAWADCSQHMPITPRPDPCRACPAKAWVGPCAIPSPASQQPLRCSLTLGLSCAALLPDEVPCTTSSELVTGDDVVTAGWYQVRSVPSST